MSSIKTYTGVMFDPVNPESERIDIAHLHQITASPFPVQPREGAISPYSEDTFLKSILRAIYITVILSIMVCERIEGCSVLFGRIKRKQRKVKNLRKALSLLQQGHIPDSLRVSYTKITYYVVGGLGEYVRLYSD